MFYFLYKLDLYNKLIFHNKIQSAADATDDQADTADNDEAAEVEDPYADFRRELRRKPGKWYVVHSTPVLKSA